MKVFISHSSQDGALYSSTAGIIKLNGISIWNAQEMIAGQSLSVQLMKATQEASQCVFLATRNSINSPWCMAELGAFWSSEKPVIIYRDSGIDEEYLPPQFNGNMHTDNVDKLIESLKKIYSRIPPDPMIEEYGENVSRLIQETRDAAAEGNYLLAYHLSREIIDMSSECIHAYGNMATALVHLRRYNEAEEIYKSIIEKFSNKCKIIAKTQHNLAWLEINRSGLDEREIIHKCKELYSISLSLDGTRVVTMAMHLICLGLLRNEKEAHEHLYKYIKWKGFIEELRHQVELLGFPGFKAIEILPKWLEHILFAPRGACFSTKE